MAEEKSLNFLEEIIEEDLKSGKYKSYCTRVFRLNQMVICISAMQKAFV